VSAPVRDHDEIRDDTQVLAGSPGG
jgi:hypothetical protein